MIFQAPVKAFEKKVKLRCCKEGFTSKSYAKRSVSDRAKKKDTEQNFQVVVGSYCATFPRKDFYFFATLSEVRPSL